MSRIFLSVINSFLRFLFLEPSIIKKTAESEEAIRRAAEREGRRTRRRCEREKNNTLCSHLDGMSSDEEVSDQDMSLLRNSIGEFDGMVGPGPGVINM